MPRGRALGSQDDGDLVLRFPYFESAGPVVLDDPGTYTDDGGTPAAFEHGITYEWNHGLGEIVQAVIDAGLTVRRVAEHTECEWNALPHLMEEAGGGRYRLREGVDRLPLMFSLEAVKPSAGM